MASTPQNREASRTPSLPTDPSSRYWIRSGLGLLLLATVALPFFTLLAVIERQVPQVLSFDARIADRLNALANDDGVVLESSLALTQLGGTAVAVAVFVVVALLLGAGGHRRLAAYVSATGLGVAVLILTSKALVGRPRPLVDAPVTELPVSGSFPSGHTATAVALFGCLAVVALWRTRLPAVVRGVVVAVVVVGCVAVGLTRLVLGVHYVTDVVAGWSLGTAWLAVTTWALHMRRAEQSPTRGSTAMAVRPGSVRQPQRTATTLALCAAWVSVVVVVVGAGLVITGPLASPAVSRLDTWVTQQLLTVRSDFLTTVARAGSAVAGTVVVVSVLLAATMTLRKSTATWRPAIFLVACVAGEALAYLASSRIVDRIRPSVADLTTGLPDAASWPSGHVAAAVALYGGLALVMTSTRRGATLAVAAVVVACVAVVGGSRVYLAAHYASDVLAGAALGVVWLTACWLILRPSSVHDRAPRYDAQTFPQTTVRQVPGQTSQQVADRASDVRRATSGADGR